MQNLEHHLHQATEALRKEWSFLEPQALPLERIRDRSAVFVREIEIAGKTVETYIKIYANKKHPLQRVFRKSRSSTEVRNLLFFKNIGIPTPSIVAWGELKNQIGRSVQDFIITEAIPGALQLDQYVAAHCPDQTTPEYCKIRDQIIEQLGQWTANMHAHDFIHEDLKWRNILAKPSEQGCELYWIDCPKGSFRKGAGIARKKLKDCATLDKIARFQCSREERKRFLSAYLERPADSSEVAAMCDKVQQYRARRFDAKDDRQRNS